MRHHKSCRLVRRRTTVPKHIGVGYAMFVGASTISLTRSGRGVALSWPENLLVLGVEAIELEITERSFNFGTGSSIFSMLSLPLAIF